MHHDLPYMLHVHHRFDSDSPVGLDDALSHSSGHLRTRVPDVDLPGCDAVDTTVEDGRLSQTGHRMLGRRVGRQRPDVVGPPIQSRY